MTYTRWIWPAFVCVFLCLGALFAVQSTLAASRFQGTWRGTYQSQPTELRPDGSYPEEVNEFEIRIIETRGKISGTFRRMRQGADTSVDLANGRRFGSRACFDVVSDGDMRWCVEVRGDKLTGTWSEGPEGGPLSGGAGIGARLFLIQGKRLI